MKRTKKPAKEIIPDAMVMNENGDGVDWILVRRIFETEPDVSFSMLAKKAGVSKQAVSYRSKKEGWIRAGFDPKEKALIRAAAIHRANRSKVLGKPIKPADVISPDPDPVIDVVSEEDANFGRHLSVLDAAIEIRSEILQRHRSEANIPRNLIYEAMKIRDPATGALNIAKASERVKLAKAVAETISIVQKAERIAYGLDSTPTRRVTLVGDASEDPYD